MGSEANRRVVDFGGVSGMIFGAMGGSVVVLGIVILPMILWAIRDAACLQVCDGVGSYNASADRCSCRVADGE